MKRLLVAILLLTPLSAFAWDGASVAKDTIVPVSHEYVFRGDRTMMLDVYTPAVPRADSAAVMYLFGGGFIMGSRTDKYVRNYCQMLADHGYTAIAIDYRLYLKEVDFSKVSLVGSIDVFRDAINYTASDCAAAIAFICSRATEFGVNPDRIVLCGSSAGAIGVLQLDYCRANSLPPADELPAGWKPAAVVAYSGAVFCERTKPKYATPPVPTFFLHGDKDRIVNFKKFPPVLRTGLYGPKKLHKVFEKNNYPHWFFKFEGIGHEVAAIPQYMFEEMESFVDKTLRGAEMYYDATVRDNSIQPTEWSKLDVSDLYKR